MSKVLVTGASGFMGSHIADELSSRGHEVLLLDVAESPYKKPEQKMIIGDLANQDLLDEITRGVEYVFHLAAMADIGECSERPRDVVSTNILGTVDLLEACKKNNVKRFVFASSAYVFSKFGSFYRSSKRACENFIVDYQEKYGLSYVILRFGSLYGSRSNEKNGIYKIIQAMLKNDEYNFYGTGEEIRELINIYDAAKISVDCLQEQYKNTKLLVTGIERLKMKDIIDMVKEIIGRDVKVNYSDKSQAHHYKITPYNYDLTQSYKITNNPYVDIGQGIIQVIQEILNGQ